jgi:hypothetical protein
VTDAGRPVREGFRTFRTYRTFGAFSPPFVESRPYSSPFRLDRGASATQLV